LKDNAGAFWSLTERAALEYRAGRAARAVPLLEQSLKADAAPGRAVLNWLWLALAHRRLGNGAEARRRLDKAATFLKEVGAALPDDADERLGLHLHNWLEAQVLRREAEKRLAADKP
jgi:hypothetical protein